MRINSEVFYGNTKVRDTVLPWIGWVFGGWFLHSVTVAGAGAPYDSKMEGVRAAGLTETKASKDGWLACL